MTTQLQFANRTSIQRNTQSLSIPAPEQVRDMDSDLKFIDWSRSTYEDSYDVVGLSTYINGLEKSSLKGLDVGGGIGIFAETVIHCCEADVSMTVVDPGIKASEQRVKHPGIDFHLSTFDEFSSNEKYDFIVFRLVLHHLIGHDAQDTLRVQREALQKAKSLLNEGGFLFVVENYYEPMVGTDSTSRLIYWLTSRKSVSTVTRRLGANTAGEGVRFRSKCSWESMFRTAGFSSQFLERHPWWGNDMPWWQRVPLLCKERYQAISVLTL